MKAAYWLLGCCLAFTTTLHAQTTDAHVTFSAPIEEPASGWCKLMLLKNGNTFFLRFTRKDGILVNIYDGAHALQSADTLRSALCDLKAMNDTEVDGLYEINGQVVIFLQQLVKYKPTLYRIVLNGSNGHLVQEDKLGELFSIQKRQAMALNNAASFDCYVEKDPNSDYYAVAFFNGSELAHDTSDKARIQVVHYAPDHHELHRANFYTADSSYDYFNYLHMQVQGGDAVYIASMAFNMHTNKREEDARLMVSRLGAKDTCFTHQPLDHQRGEGYAYGLLQCVPGQPVRLLVTATPADASKKMTRTPGAMPVYFDSFDAQTLKPLAHELLPLSGVSSYAKAHLEYTDDYTGMLQQWVPLADGSSVILQESIRQFIQGGATFNKSISGLGDAGITQLDANGKEQQAVVVNKMQSAAGMYEPFYQYRRNKSEWSFRNKSAVFGVNGYLSYAFVKNKKGNFILFNQYTSNLPGDYVAGTKPLRLISDASLVCFKYNDGQMLLQKLFPPPATLIESPKYYACMLDAAGEDAASSMYATVMIEHNDTLHKAYIAWISF